MLQLFPNGRATDNVFVTLFCIAVGTAIAWCGGRCAMPDGHCPKILFFGWRSTAASVFRVGACFEVSLFCLPLPLVPVPNRPSRLRGRKATKTRMYRLGEPLWSSGKAGKQKGLGSIPLRLSFLFKKVAVYGHYLVTLSLTNNEISLYYSLT